MSQGIKYQPARTDAYPTQTTREQAQAESVLAAHRPASDQETKPALQRNVHLQWLVRNFAQGFPARMVSQDASQPWLIFWTIQSFYLLGAALDPQNKQRCIDTLMACQHPDGGFGGGPGQFPHLLPTYAAVSALAVIGRPGPGGGWDQIDCEKMYTFFLTLKQPDGSFLVSRDSEVDVRGIYCLLCVASLLNLLTPELVSGTAAFVASLQTYEGGFASASHPYFAPGSQPDSLATLLAAPRPPLGEAHGGYTFCALASWVLLRPFLALDTSTQGAPAPAIDLRRLVRWLAHMQGARGELGGFRGRTNKLVDACYSWWVGGCFPLLQALGVGAGDMAHSAQHPPEHHEGVENEDDQWDDLDESIFDRIGLQEYILYGAQHPAGGLRDKPPKISDAYHTLYALSGLSTAQHHVTQSNELRKTLLHEWKKQDAEPRFDDMRKTAYVEARTWKEEEGSSAYVNGAGDRINATHPIFNLTMTHVKEILNHFYRQG